MQYQLAMLWPPGFQCMAVRLSPAHNYQLDVVPGRPPSIQSWGSSETVLNTKLVLFPRQTGKMWTFRFWKALEPFNQTKMYCVLSMCPKICLDAKLEKRLTKF